MTASRHAPRRRRSQFAAAVLLLFVAAAPAHPPFAPTRDVSVTYRVESPDAHAPRGETTNELRLRATAGGRRLRLDTPGSEAYLLIDPAAKSASMVDPKIRAFMTVPLNPKVARGLLLLDPAAAYRQIGRSRVAGLSCTVWAVGPNGKEGGGKEGSVCVTADGVILSRIEGGAPADRARLTATAVTFAVQPEALFTPPPGFQDLSLQRAPVKGGGVPAPPAGGPSATPPRVRAPAGLPLPPMPPALPLPPIPSAPTSR